jgi:hypothetical protein
MFILSKLIHFHGQSKNVRVTKSLVIADLSWLLLVNELLFVRVSASRLFQHIMLPNIQIFSNARLQRWKQHALLKS